MGIKDIKAFEIEKDEETNGFRLVVKSLEDTNCFEFGLYWGGKEAPTHTYTVDKMSLMEKLGEMCK